MYYDDCTRVVLFDLPCAVNGFVVSDGFDFYTIVINSRLSFEMQQKTYKHEMEHIVRGDISRMQDPYSDLYSEIGADRIEALRRILAEL